MGKLLHFLTFTLFFFLFFTTVYGQSNQTVNNGSNTTAVNFTGATCTYHWVNSNPSIGLPASGTGNIPSFKAVNNGSTPVTGTITATPVGSGFAYIVNAGSDNVSVINTANNAIVTTIPVGSNPNSVCVDPNYNEVYVVNNSSNTVSVISTVTNMVTATIPVGPTPWSVTVSPDGSLAYVADGGDNDVEVIDATTNKIVKKIPAGTNPNALAISPDGNFLYVNNSNSVAVINASTGTLVTSIPVGSAPQAILITPDGSTVYEANFASDNVYAISTATNTVKAIIPVGSNPGGGSMSPDGSVVYIANLSSNNVSVINTITNTITTTIPVGSNPWGVSVRPDGSQIYVANAGSNSISVINPATNALIATIPAGDSPYSFGKFFTGGMGCSEIIKFDITVNAASATISAGTATGAISACVGAASASPDIQHFTVSGTHLSGNIIATAPAGFQVSLSAGSGYAASVPISPVSGAVNSTIVYVRSAASDAAGKISGSVVLTSSGATSQNVAVTGIVNALPAVNAVSNQTVPNGAATSAVTFTGTANTYTWVNDNPGIGLAASGTGDIGSFKAVNTGSTPVKATITVTPASNAYAYIASGGSDIVSIINVNTNKLSVNVPVNTGPVAVAVSADGSRAYITNSNVSTVTVIGTATNTIIKTFAVGKFPFGLAVSPDGSKLYVANQADNNISVINTSTYALITTINSGGNPYGVAVSPDGTRVYVTNLAGGNVTVINALTNTVIASIDVESDPYGITVSPDGSKIYVANNLGSSVSVIDAATNTVSKTIGVGSHTSGVALSPDGKYLYVTNAGDNTVSVINTGTNTVIKTIAVGNTPEGISVTADGQSIYVVNELSDDVWIINTTTYGVTAKVGAGLNPLTLGNFITNGTGCPGVPISFTITVNAASKITATGLPVALTTVYGSPSVSSSFTVSGANLTAGILVTPPTGFEVGTDGTNFDNSVTVGAAGATSSAIVYIRLKATTPVGGYSGNIVLTSLGATNVTVAMRNSTVTPAPLTIIANGVTKHFGTVLTGGPGSTAFTSSGLKNAETIGTVSINYGLGAAANAAIGTYTASVNASTATGGTFLASNYNITFIPANIIVTAVPVSAIASGGVLSPLNTVYGTASITTSFTVSGQNLTTGILVTPPAGFEISTDGATFNRTVTVGSAGDVASTIVYIRLAATTHVGTYTGNIILSSTNADTVSVLMPPSTVRPAPLTVTADNKSKTYDTENPVLTVSYNGFQNSDGPSQLTEPPSLSTTATISSPAGNYPITADGAASGDYNFIYVPGTLTITQVLSAFTIPNVFTPNGDGVNDTWDIPNLATDIKCTVDVFDRYGQKVFSSVGYGTPWDGKCKGAEVPAGTYYYIINPKNNQKALSGWITLIK